MKKTQTVYDYRLLPRKLFQPTPAQKQAFISALVFGAITHLYQLTNLLGNDDTLGLTADHYFTASSWEGVFGGASSGRWFLNLSELFITWFHTPITSGVFILLSLALIAVFVVAFLRIESTAGAVLTGALLTVFPTTIGYFSLQSVAYPLSVLLATMAVYVSERGTYGWLVGAVLLGLGISIFPVNVSFALMLILLRMLATFLAAPVLTRKNVLKPLLKYAGMIIGGGIILLLGTAVCKNLFPQEITNYQGAGEVMTGGVLANLPRGMYWTIAKTYTLGYDKMPIVPAFRFALIGCYAAIVALAGYLFFANKYHKHFTRWLGISACVVALPISLNTILLVSPEFSQRAHHRMQWVLVFVCAIMLGELAFRRLQQNNTVRSQRTAKGILLSVCVIIGILIYGFFLFCNIGYYNQQYVMEKDRSLVTRILSKLDQTEDFSYDQPVYFLSILEMGDENTSTSPLRYDLDLYKNMFPDTETNLWAYGDYSFKRTISTYAGIELPELPEETEEKIENSSLSEEYEDLKAGEFVIVKYAETDVWVIVTKQIIPYSVYYSH